MKWEDRNTATTQAQKVQALMDGLHKNIPNVELADYADAEGIPFERQGKTVATAPVATAPIYSDSVDPDEDEDYEESYEESYEDSYYDSGC